MDLQKINFKARGNQGLGFRTREIYNNVGTLTQTNAPVRPAVKYDSNLDPVKTRSRTRRSRSNVTRREVSNPVKEVEIKPEKPSSPVEIFPVETSPVETVKPKPTPVKPLTPVKEPNVPGTGGIKPGKEVEPMQPTTVKDQKEPTGPTNEVAPEKASKPTYNILGFKITRKQSIYGGIGLASVVAFTLYKTNKS